MFYRALKISKSCKLVYNVIFSVIIVITVKLVNSYYKNNNSFFQIDVTVQPTSKKRLINAFKVNKECIMNKYFGFR